MKNNWKSFFEKNKTEFQLEFPIPVGHEKRFLQKLNKHKKKSKKSFGTWKVAAVLIPMLMIVSYWFINNSTQNNVTNFSLEDFSPELGEAENYFAFVIREKVEEVKSLQTPENAQLIEHSLLEINNLQTQYNQLLLDLKESGGNPQVIKSIMMNLQLQIKVLETVLNQIEFQQELKHTPNEEII